VVARELDCACVSVALIVCRRLMFNDLSDRYFSTHLWD